MPDSLGDGPKRNRPFSCSMPLGLVAASCGIRFKYSADLITNLAKHLHLLFVASRRVSRVIESPMVTVPLAGKHWASLVRVATDSDDGFNRLLQKFVHVLGTVGGDVDSDFSERSNGERMDKASWFASRACDSEPCLRGSAKDAFRHVASTGISCAEDKNQWERIFAVHFLQKQSGSWVCDRGH